MNDETKTKKQLIRELGEMRQRIAELEAAEAECGRAHKALEEERDLLQALIDCLSEAGYQIYAKDRQSRFLIVNQHTLERLKNEAEKLDKPIRVDSVDDIKGKTDLDLIRRSFAEYHYAEEQAAMESGKAIIEREQYSVKRDGERAFAVYTKVPFRDRDGKVIGIACLNRLIREQKLAEEKLQEKVAERTAELTETNERLEKEIAERKQTEEALQESEQRYRDLFEHMPVGLYRTTPDGRSLETNQALNEMLGTMEDETLPERFAAEFYVNPEDRKRWQALMEREGVVRDFEVSLRRFDGRCIWVQDTARAVRDAQGRVVYYEGSLKDITKQKRAEDALRESEQTAETLLNASTDTALLIDSDGVILALNEATAATFDHPREELIGTCVYDLFPPEVAEHRRARADEVFRSGKPIHFEDKRQGRWFDQEVYPLLDTEGKVRRVAIVAHDITEQKEREEAAREHVVGLTEALRSAGARHEFVGESRSLRKVLAQIQGVAQTDLTVLVLGETGTGKGLAARVVHGLSARKEGPFIQVNCGAIPDGLIESELFGHEKGGFTGAISRKLGKIELAEGGTLFLDEVGDLTSAAQSKLLRFLEERTFERIGGTKTLKVDARVIAATNRDLERMVSAGQFREDLYFRLQAFPVHLPLLRDRREDVPLLATYFAERFARHLNRPIPKIDPEAMECLHRYTWPGNVRELEHLMQRAVLSCKKNVIGVRDIPGVLVRATQPSKKSKFLSLAEYERRYLEEALKATDWVIYGQYGAARLLDVHPEKLRARMRKHGLRRPL